MNIATETMKKMTEMLRNVNKKYKEMATEPYGMVKLTRKEQQERFDALTPEDVYIMLEEKGVDATNEYLSRFMKENNNAR